MRSDPAQFDLIAPGSLDAVLDILSHSANRYTPIAGGTELMVALGTGRLEAKKLISLWNLEELRFIEATSDAIVIGAGSTFNDIRSYLGTSGDLPLLTQAASWTGSIANQNRATLGGNIVNASPAADSSPALLVYEATVTLISARGERTIPYRDFHLSYKKTALAPDEILYRVTVPRNFKSYRQYIRKVGTRNAQAISKTALAAIAHVDNGRVKDIRIAAASLREVPTRLPATEQALLGKAITADTIHKARAVLIGESKPIDDIRSTARYRATVAANLLEEFLSAL
jgi:CO/xanthine dehydrogenase FAD-binding subunit